MVWRVPPENVNIPDTPEIDNVPPARIFNVGEPEKVKSCVNATVPVLILIVPRLKVASAEMVAPVKSTT